MHSIVKVPIEYPIKAIQIKVYSIIRTAKVELLITEITFLFAYEVSIGYFELDRSHLTLKLWEKTEAQTILQTLYIPPRLNSLRLYIPA